MLRCTHRLACLSKSEGPVRNWFKVTPGKTKDKHTDLKAVHSVQRDSETGFQIRTASCPPFAGMQSTLDLTGQNAVIFCCKIMNMIAFLPCKRLKCMKQFISILQHSYCSQQLPCKGIKGWNNAPRLKIPPEKTYVYIALAWHLVHGSVSRWLLHQLWLSNNSVLRNLASLRMGLRHRMGWLPPEKSKYLFCRKLLQTVCWTLVRGIPSS